MQNPLFRKSSSLRDQSHHLSLSKASLTAKPAKLAKKSSKCARKTYRSGMTFFDIKEVEQLQEIERD